MLQESFDNDYTVSVVIPAYNSAKYLPRAIDSVFKQTLLVDEIIVVDDGSTDNTAEVAASFGDKIRYIYQENAGASAARNVGINVAKSKWIAFLDADDEWLPEKQQLQIDLAKRNTSFGWITGNYYLLDSGNNKKTIAIDKVDISKIEAVLDSNNSFTDFFSAYLSRGHGHTDTMLIKRELLNQAGLFDINLPRINDYDMWLRVAYLGNRLGFISKPISIYYTNISSSIVSTYKDAEHFERFLDKHLELSRQNGYKRDFIPCATLMLKWWVGCLIKSRDGSGARSLLNRYGRMLDPHFKRTSLVSSYVPKISNLYNALTGGGILGKKNKGLRSGKS